MLPVMNYFAEDIYEAEGTTIDMGTDNKGQKGKLDGDVQSALDSVLKNSLSATSTTDGVPAQNRWAKQAGAVSSETPDKIDQENVKFNK
jgi:hypothetical protein